MGKIDSILKTLGIKESEEDELLLESDIEINEGPVEPKMKPAEPVSGNNRHIYDRKVVGMNTGSSSIREGGNNAALASAMMKVVVINPKSIDDCQQIANCLKESVQLLSIWKMWRSRQLSALLISSVVPFMPLMVQ